MNKVEQDALELGWQVAALLSLQEKITVQDRFEVEHLAQPQRPQVHRHSVCD
jgi:hypothetical protein